MKKWIKGLLVTTVIAGGTLGGAYYMGYQYKVPSFTSYVLEKNTELTNYERKLSISLSFDEKNESISKEDSLAKLDGSVLVLKEKKTEQGETVEYSLTSQGEDFSGVQQYTGDGLIAKSPMYHRYVDFYDTPFGKEEKQDLSYLKESVYQFVKDTNSNMKVYRDIGGNEKGVKTLVIKGENEKVETALKEVTSQLNNGFPYESILLTNERITNRLLKEHLSDQDVEQKFKGDIKTIQDSVEGVLSHSKVTDSEISIKINEKQMVKSWSAVIQLTYTNPETNQELPFTLYLDLNTWNIGKTNIEPIEIDILNSIRYERMTDDMDFFEDENLLKEENASEDKNHTQQGVNEDNKQGFEENTSTLKELGDDFTPILPEKKEGNE
ncbi:hypothetical protein CVD28_04275 [Bacillus sp. M6-12]|uniref:hypothetical protein n=1 Tax=Bacillus sp. M6-12 TaxID=2054166 RepID=UPI000C78A0A7|nr:hypothetical protein [Bacillus sp. M6-12]PLS19641.1 hypothetical protein CVD28_04275 [Bacillus sp. M6-12]